MHSRRQVFITIFIAASIILTALPALTTFSSVLTKLFLSMRWYVVLQDIVVPFEARLVSVIIRLIGINAYITPGQTFALALKHPAGNFTAIELQWNCLGWQSMIFLAITLVAGLRGKYTLISKAETVLFGLVGTFLINLFRMAFIITLAYYWNKASALLFHDYFATFVSFVWIVAFWWFSYRYLLEPNIKSLDQSSH